MKVEIKKNSEIFLIIEIHFIVITLSTINKTLLYNPATESKYWTHLKKLNIRYKSHIITVVKVVTY